MTGLLSSGVIERRPEADVAISYTGGLPVIKIATVATLVGNDHFSGDVGARTSGEL
jgi:hypothetical protein